MLGNENIASKPRADRASPPRCHFLHHVMELKTNCWVLSQASLGCHSVAQGYLMLKAYLCFLSYAQVRKWSVRIHLIQETMFIIYDKGSWPNVQSNVHHFFGGGIKFKFQMDIDTWSALKRDTGQLWIANYLTCLPSPLPPPPPEKKKERKGIKKCTRLHKVHFKSFFAWREKNVYNLTLWYNRRLLEMSSAMQ